MTIPTSHHKKRSDYTGIWEYPHHLTLKYAVWYDGAIWYWTRTKEEAEKLFLNAMSTIPRETNE